MCGLAVIIDTNNSISTDLIAPIFKSMEHRGPDDENYYHSDDVLACHSRLIVEGSKKGGRQPLVSASGRYIVLVNGELYPYQELRRSLEVWGYDFTGDSDSELALALYLRFGDDFVHHLRGEYSVIIWDSYKKRLLAVRDRFGIKPLLYCEQKGRWSFASEAKTLFSMGNSAAWSLAGLSESFSFQYLLPGNCLFAGIEQVPAGHLLIIENNTSTQNCYWKPEGFHGVRTGVELVDEVKQHLHAAVKMRMPRTLRSAFTLSGGLDSSAITAIAQQYASYDLDCYCVSFDDDNYSELAQAEAFSRSQGLNLTPVIINRNDLILDISNAAYFSEGLASNGQYVGKYRLYQEMAKGGYRVAMSGEGADEAFMGYAHLVREYTAFNSIENNTQVLNDIFHSGKLQQGLMLASESVGPSWLPNFLQAKLGFCQNFTNLFEADFKRKYLREKELAFIKLKDICGARRGESRTERSARVWQQLVLGGYILKTLGDGMEMASSIEGRLPFLDHKLFELALSIHADEKIQGAFGKYILRESLIGILPNENIRRHKHPFIAPPLTKNVSVEAEEYIFDTLLGDAMRDSQVFDYEEISKYLICWKNNINIRKECDPVIMMLLSFASLAKHFNVSDVR